MQGSHTSATQDANTSGLACHNACPLRQYNDSDGHVSLVRFVRSGSRDPHHRRSRVFANESSSRTGTSTSQTS